MSKKKIIITNLLCIAVIVLNYFGVADDGYIKMAAMVLYKIICPLYMAYAIIRNIVYKKIENIDNQVLGLSVCTVDAASLIAIEMFHGLALRNLITPVFYLFAIFLLFKVRPLNRG